MGDCKRWRSEQKIDPSTPTFEEWVSGTLRNTVVDVQTLVNVVYETILESNAIHKEEGIREPFHK
jgi:hypothetical protein